MDLAVETLRARFASGERSPVAVAEALLDRAAGSTAFAAFDPEGALAAARDARRAYADGSAGPLTGIPVAVKDLADTAGIPTGYGSPLFAGHIPPRDAPVVAALRAAGAVVLGKTRTHEFAWGITSEPTGHGPCRNPRDRERTAGGSSGGSAVAVAEGLCSFAIGTDTAGSVRIPAAFCGTVGFKPSFGTLPVEGVFALAPSFDTVGVLALTVADARAATEALIAVAGARPPQRRHGRDDPETTTRPGGDGRAPGPTTEAGELRVGVLRHPFEPALAPGVRAAFDAARAALGDPPDLPLDLDADPAPAFFVVQAAEALEVHRTRGRWPAGSDGYDPANRRRLEAAERRSPAEVAVAREQLARVRAAVDAALATVDVALAPIHAVVAPRLGEGDDLRGDVLPFTIPQSVAGVPTAAVPVGRAEHGLPVGVQLCAARGADDRVLAMATILEGQGLWPS